MKERITIIFFWIAVISASFITYFNKDIPDGIPGIILLISRGFIRPENTTRWRYAAKSFWIGLGLTFILIPFTLLVKTSWAVYIFMPLMFIAGCAILIWLGYIIFSDSQRLFFKMQA